VNETINGPTPEESKGPIINAENPIHTDEQGNKWSTVSNIIRMFPGLTDQRVLNYTRLCHETWKLGYDEKGNFIRLYLISPDWREGE
jgi:hypothetical protein